MAATTRKLKTTAIKKPVARKSILRRIFSPTTLIILGSLLLISGGVFTYFYIKYSKLIDARLEGNALIRTTEIYASPRVIRVGQAVTMDEIKRQLDRSGYVESTKEADANRGRYQIKGNSLEIQTSSEALINNVRQFPNLVITFSAGGKTISKIVDADSKRQLDSAQIEPEEIASIASDKERQKQKLVTFKDLPKDYRDAVVAIEDRQFFEHSGINFRGIARALWRNVEENEIQQGGSSITQQLVKNFFLSPERTWKRKLQEMMMAIVLETKLSKEEIFQLYTNEIYMGRSGSYAIHGVGEAALTYFGKDVVNLTLPEAAFLAGIIRGPSLYSPYRDAERAKARRNQVLDSMVEAGFITRDAADKAKAAELKILPKRSAVNSNAPYFLDYLQSAELASRDLGREPHRVYTTIDMELQRAAEKSVNENLSQLDPIFSRRRKNPIPPGTLQAALVAINAKTGEVMAMVGGRDYSASQLNRAVEANRQPGSVFKPIVYAAALNTAFEDANEDLITPASLFLDSPETFYYGRGQTYEPGNFGDKYSNKDVSLRDALVSSLNVVTVKVAEKVGYAKVSRMAEKLGLPRPQALPSTALGAAEATPLQVARAYTAFANGGLLANTTQIRRITNSSGVNILDAKPETRPVIKPEIAWLMTSLMQDVMTRGTAARAKSLASIAAGKTGTSRDGWFAGYTSNIVCVVWVGFDDNSELGLEGSKSALPIWLSFMNQALRLRPDLAGSGFTKPDGAVEAEIDPATGFLASPQCPTKRKEYFIQGTEPQEVCAAPAGNHTAAEARARAEQDDDSSERPRRVTPEDEDEDRDDKKDDKKKDDKKKDDKKDGKKKDDH